MRRYGQTSPLVARQHALYQDGSQPYGRSRPLLRTPQFGFLGAAGASVYSGPPIGEGAGQGAKTGAMQGASLGTTIMPGIGTAIGAVVGAIGGAIAGAIGKKDPEEKNFSQAVAVWQQNASNVYLIGNKYLVLAGLFDLNLKGPHIPIYLKYGRMGEQHFVTDMVNLIYQAAQSGKITAADTPLTIMTRVVQPWIDSWGFGPMQDPHADMINKIILGMIAEYVAGQQSAWTARGGDYPFGSLPKFSLPTAQGASAPTPQAQYAPTPQVIASPVSAVTTPAPVATTAPQAVPAPPASVLTTDGSSVTAGQNAGVRTAAGQTLYFGMPPIPGFGGYMIYVDGQSAANGSASVIGLLNGGTAYVQNKQGDWFQWTGATWKGLSSAPTQTSTTPAPAGSVPIPAGFMAVGNANGMGAYRGADGLIYSWNGTTMTPLTGILNTPTSDAIPYKNGKPDYGDAYPTTPPPALSTGSQQLANTYPTSTFLPGPLSVDTSGASAPAQPAVAAAGIGSGMPPWVAWAGVAGVVGFFILGGKPLKGGRPSRVGARR